ncbi:hypothetical protein [Dyadobacter fermentans]|uniref:DUF4440 domain-containing protein n=1 Tax=Dyadobacter fermentans (strain ATCC 700827 / DSM 18053 / CIP 107007 / KCTC 52180 / NS114) TaxID=471854 RepID=C6W4H1_DYAFD|nr:hypothetical protein [Dyadobacter fermentans]ACT94072.1 conserved hypothetical protein [Dyadobacter fermentans DSM 18053]
MADINDQIEQFFDAYEKRFADGLAGQEVGEDTASAFADFFVEASPMGIIGGKNDQEFRERVPQGYDFYRSIGITKMAIRQLDITELNELHYMVEVYWESFYEKDGQPGSIEFSVIYFLQHLNGALKVFAYITGDEQAVLKERGLV